MLSDNLILKTDSYKFSHAAQYPKGTEHIYSYFESRVGAEFHETVFFGLQYYIKKFLVGQVITKEKIAEAKAFVEKHIGPGAFNEEGWNYILEKHEGKLPIVIRAVPEGTPIPVNNVLMTVENTDPKCFWLTNYLETLLVQVWYACTVATLSRENKKNILKYLEETGDPSLINFKLHDFGYRGVSSDESAAIGGAAHLVNFMGTDTVAGIVAAMEYYNAKEMVGFSIPASEHSTITSWGRENEGLAFENMLTVYKDFALVACVSDSNDIYNACKNLWGGSVKSALDKFKGTLVIRPDSGDPIKLLPDLLSILVDKFGATRNSKGYLVLNPKVRLIQGDGIDYYTIPKILEALKSAGFSADNLAFGSGGGLLQKVNRDTQRFAFKCSAAEINGKLVPVSKNPITDGTKKSKEGVLELLKNTKTGEFATVDNDKIPDYSPSEGWVKVLDTVFRDGQLIKEYTFDEIRKNASL